MWENRFWEKDSDDHLYLPQVDVALKDPWRNSENNEIKCENEIDL